MYQPNPNLFQARTPSPVNAPPVTIMSSTTNRTLGSSPDPFDGSADKAEDFWAALETYYLLNKAMYNDDEKKVLGAITFMKPGTSAGTWTQEQHRLAFAKNPVTFGTWKDFKKTFASHFIPAELVLESTQQMHNLRMGNREFNNWYQEWSTHTTRSGADEATRMYAFRRMLPLPLHQKILGTLPQPANLQGLVDKAREFDRLWRVYKPQETRMDNRNSTGNRGRFRARATITEEDGPSINYANLEAQGGKITKEEKERRYKEGLCFFCGIKGHDAKRCNKKKNRDNQRGPRPNFKRDMKARTLTSEETKQEDQNLPLTPPSYQSQQSHMILRISIPQNRFNIIHPASAPLNEDF